MRVRYMCVTHSLLRYIAVSDFKIIVYIIQIAFR